MVHIEVFNLCVRIRTESEKIISVIKSFIEQNYTQKLLSNNPNNKEQAQYVFASKTIDEKEFYLHRRQYTHLLQYLDQGYPNLKEYFTVTKDNFKEDYDIEPLNLTLNKNIELRDYQRQAVDFCLQDKCKSKLIPLQTGKGKTVIGMAAACAINQRLSIVVLPNYIDKWISDVKALTDIKDEDINVIQGSKNFKASMEVAQLGNYDYKITIISLTTFRNLISEYEDDPEYFRFAYGFIPIDIFPTLNVGLMLIDETHQHFNGIFKILLHSNIKKQIGLSATLMTEDAIVKRSHYIVYHSECRFEGLEYDRYCNIYAIGYSINEMYLKKIRTSEFGSNNYSHNAFEKSILRDHYLQKRYLELIYANINDYFMEEYETRDKCLVFVSTVKMATTVTQYLREKYPQFDVRRYCEEDPYENVIEPDIRVTTFNSAGAAIDIPNLRVVIQTVNVSSPVVNLQSLGRLRKLSDRDVKYCYLFALNLSKHYLYHIKRKDLFYPKALHFLERKSRSNL